MHVQIINYQIQDLSEEDYLKLCNDIAPTFAAVPGLLAKVWLANPDTKTFGGVYLWRDREAMDQYAKTDLARSVATHPNLANVTSTDFAAIEEPTKITRGLLG
jgi:hypothetical protein